MPNGWRDFQILPAALVCTGARLKANGCKMIGLVQQTVLRCVRGLGGRRMAGPWARMPLFDANKANIVSNRSRTNVKRLSVATSHEVLGRLGELLVANSCHVIPLP